MQIESGSARVTVSTADINEKLTNQTLSALQQSGAQLYLGVFVTNIQSKGQSHSVQLFMYQSDADVKDINDKCYWSLVTVFGNRIAL